MSHVVVNDGRERSKTSSSDHTSLHSGSQSDQASSHTSSVSSISPVADSSTLTTETLKHKFKRENPDLTYSFNGAFNS